MIRYERTKSSMFLLEILINILLFSVLCVCSLQFFIHSYQLTEKTTTLHQAVTACNNVAAVYEASDASTDAISEAFSGAITENNVTFIYFDKNYQECDSQSIAYYLTVERLKSEIPAIRISYYKNGEDAIYSIDTYHYQPLAPAIVNATGSTLDTDSQTEVSTHE